jgi:hypothetical protein
MFELSPQVKTLHDKWVDIMDNQPWEGAAQATALDALSNAVGLLNVALVAEQAEAAFSHKPENDLHKEILMALAKALRLASLVHQVPLDLIIPAKLRHKLDAETPDLARIEVVSTHNLGDGTSIMSVQGMVDAEVMALINYGRQIAPLETNLQRLFELGMEACLQNVIDEAKAKQEPGKADGKKKEKRKSRKDK